MFRSIKYFFQRLVRGWDDRETWNLDFEFYKWLYPRLVRFKKISLTVPPNKTAKEWDIELNTILDLIELYLLDEESFFSDKREVENAKKWVNHWFFNNFNYLKW